MIINNINNSEKGKLVIKKTKNNNVLIYYYASWCGYCQKFKDEWTKIKKTITTNNICDIIEVESEELKYVTPLKSHFKGFPTLILYTKSKINKPKNNKGLIDFFMNNHDEPKLPYNAIKYDNERLLSEVIKFLNLHLNNQTNNLETNNKTNNKTNNLQTNNKTNNLQTNNLQTNNLQTNNKTNNLQTNNLQTNNLQTNNKTVKLIKGKSKKVKLIKNKGKKVKLIKNKSKKVKLIKGKGKSKTLDNKTRIYNPNKKKFNYDSSYYTKKEIQKMKKERQKNSKTVSRLKQELSDQFKI